MPLDTKEGQVWNGNDRNLRRVLVGAENAGLIGPVDESNYLQFSMCTFNKAHPSQARAMSLAEVSAAFRSGCLGQATAPQPAPAPAPIAVPVVTAQPVSQLQPSLATATNPLIRTPSMSLALDAAKAGTMMQTTQAAPGVSAGIFGTIGRVLGGAATGFLSGGPLGALGGAIGGIAGGGGAMPGTGLPVTPPFVPVGQQPVMPGPRQQDVLTRRFKGFQLGPLEVGSEEELIQKLAADAAAVGAAAGGIGCPAGHRPNKTSYFLKDGTFVPKGSRCVKIRRRNPNNPRALSRAISRIESAKKAQKRISRVTIRKKC